MRRNTRVLLVLVLSILGAACWVMVAPPAQAELNGPCQATGAFAQGTDGAGPFTVDVAAVGTQTVTVPRQDSVSWTGSVPAAPGAYSGQVAVELPPPFGDVTIDSWEGTTDATSNQGVEDYDLPALVPSGVEFRVVGEHTDAAQSCDGFVNVVIDGGPFTKPVLPAVSLVLTLLAAAGFAAAIWPIFRRAS